MAKLKNLIASSLILLSSVSFAAEQNLEYLPTAAQWAEHTSVLANTGCILMHRVCLLVISLLGDVMTVLCAIRKAAKGRAV